MNLGDLVTVIDFPLLSETERTLVGRVFTLIRYTKPHGYAVIQDEAGFWWVHPECLLVTSKE